MKTAGTPLPHESARGHVTGEALYVDDLCGRFPRLLHAWPVLAPHAHAIVTRLDPSPALQLPGVVTVLTQADVPGEGNSGANRHDEPLFPTEVLFHHQPIAWVLGDTLDAARSGALSVAAEFDPLPAILTIEQAIEAASFLNEPLRISDGDVSAVETSALRIEGELRIGGQEHFYLETQASLAWIDEAGFISVHSSTQHPSETQEVVARALGIPRNHVLVECLRMGGAFGGKEVQANPYAAIAALGALKTKRPVRVRLTREVDIAITGKRHPYLARYVAGFESDGRMKGVRVQLYSDGGWSLDLSEPIMWRSLFHIDNAYKLPAVEIVGRVCRTHKTSQTAFRGFGGPQAMLVIEEILSQAAQRLGLPSDIVRERNFYRQGDETHYREPVREADRITLIWNQLKETSAFERRRADVAGFNARSTHQKRGIAITPVKFGISFTATFYNQAGAVVLVYRDGTVQVNHGGTEMGQGLFTKILQIASGALGVPIEQVRVMSTRTDKVPNTSATAASSGSDLNGAAVHDACLQIKKRLSAVAGAVFDCDEREVRFDDGVVSARGKSIAFGALCEMAYKQRIPLLAEGFYRTPDIHFDFKTARGRPFHYYAYGAAVSEVEVDGFTGQYRFLRTDILQDVGDSISPVIDLGQIEGGFLQGLGWLTIEELQWDARGRISSGGASTYKLPSWSEVPEVFNVETLGCATQPDVVMGSKAVGEPPLMLAISVREALREAIAAFGPGRIDSFDSPLTPERVFFAVRQVRAERTGSQIMELFRATIFHTPDNPFPLDIGDPRSLVCFEDGGLLVGSGRIMACGDYGGIRAANPGATTIDWRGGFLVPGFVDAHVHFPQLRIIGAMGRTLLDWLEHVALPEEARMADARYAADTARQFLGALAAHGTTTALVFGAHFSSATAQLFDEAIASGLRIVSGLVVSDRLLQPDLHLTPGQAYAESTLLIERYHRRGRLLYAVTPRFALSTSEAMLEICGQLMSEHHDVRMQTHINETTQEIAELARLFPWAADYLAIYERYNLSGGRSVMAHNVHASPSEIKALHTPELPSRIVQAAMLPSEAAASR